MEVGMPATQYQTSVVDTEHFSILHTAPPFVDICLQSTVISQREFLKIAEIAVGYPNDARLIEMVRLAGDASGKVPYLLEAGISPASILATLRDVAASQFEHFQGLPEALQSTICLLLSINTVPHGCETYALPALLEIERMQREMTQTLRGLMSGRQLAQHFHHQNMAVLEQLDQDWPRLRSETSSRWHTETLPYLPQMQYHPIFDYKDRLVSVLETCVLVPSPGAHLLRQLTPPVLQRPLPAPDLVPSPRSVDWLIRDSGKIGRHFTRALLGIIKAHLTAEQVEMEAGNYRLINRYAQEAIEEFVKKTPYRNPSTEQLPSEEHGGDKERSNPAYQHGAR
jgi:hypothetical protein